MEHERRHNQQINLMLFVIVALLILINILASVFLFMEGVKRSEKIYDRLEENRETFRKETMGIRSYIESKEIVICERSE